MSDTGVMTTAERLAEVRDDLITAADKATQGVCMVPVTTVRYLAALLVGQEMLARTNAVKEKSS